MAGAYRGSPSKSPIKRSVRDFDTLASIDTPTSPRDKTALHAVTTSLSPKKGKYFDGSISDDSRNMRVVGFT